MSSQTPTSPRNRLIRSVVFCVMLIVILAYAGAVLKPGRTGKDIAGGWPGFVSQRPDSIDVLFLGTSHAYTAISPSTIWRQRGIPSYVLGGPVQKLDVTWYYLQEALRTQHPRVVVLEMTAASYPLAKYDPSFHAMNVGYMPWSTNKIGAALLTSPTIDTGDILIDLIRYHARWHQLKASDFDVVNKAGGFDYFRGFVPLFTHKSVSATASPALGLPTTTATLQRLRDNLPALRALATLCRDRGIKLVLMLSPTSPSGAYTPYLREGGAALTREFDNVSVLDLSLPEAVPGLSYSSDFYDGGHVNVTGAAKASAAIATHVADTFGLPDRRTDALYRSWTADAALCDSYVVKSAADAAAAAAKKQKPRP